MAKMGKATADAVKKDKAERGKKRNNSQVRRHKWKEGTQFSRMLPPSENMDTPWIVDKCHFNLGPEKKGFSRCTETGKDCFCCKKVRKDLNDPKPSVRKMAQNRSMSISNVFLQVDVTPLYTKKKVNGKTKFVADNPPPECWGEAKKDSDGDLMGKCQRCSWGESCQEGITTASLSGQRIDDLADYFDGDTDITSLKDGRNIKVVKTVKGKSISDISYTVDASEKFAWKIPKGMRAVIEKKFIDLTEVVKPATPEETEDAWKGTDKNDDLPECFGKFDDSKKKCKKCDMADICAEEADVEEEISDEEDEDEDKPKKKKGAKSDKKSKKKEEVEEEIVTGIDLEDEDEEEEDEDLSLDDLEM